MKLSLVATTGMMFLMAACGGDEQVAPSAANATTANERFDLAVEQMTAAYFSHVPEAATQLGISEEMIPGANTRMMDRSIEGNITRNQAIEKALAALNSVDSTSISTERGRIVAITCC